MFFADTPLINAGNKTRPSLIEEFLKPEKLVRLKQPNS